VAIDIHQGAVRLLSIGLLPPVMVRARKKPLISITYQSTEKITPVDCTPRAAAQTGYRHLDSLLCLALATAQQQHNYNQKHFSRSMMFPSTSDTAS